MNGDSARRVRSAASPALRDGIRSIDVRLLPTKLEEGLVVHGFELAGARHLPVVRVIVGDVCGYGEAPPLPTFTGFDAAATAAGAEKAADPLIGRTLPEAFDALHAPEAAVPAPVRCAIDIALHDAAARLEARPLHERLGASSPGSVRISRAIGFHDLERTVALARQYVSMGIDALKLKVGRTVEIDARTVLAVREAVGPEVELSMDANEGLDVPRSRQLIDAVREAEPAYFEQPVARDDHAALRAVREAGVRVMADESVFDADDVRRLADARAVDLIGIKLVKSGGITPALQVVEASHERGLEVVLIDPLGSAVSVQAGLAVALTLGGPDRAHGLSAGLDVDAPYAPHVPIVRGRLAPVDAPGLGIDVAWPAREEVPE